MSAYSDSVFEPAFFRTYSRFRQKNIETEVEIEFFRPFSSLLVSPSCFANYGPEGTELTFSSPCNQTGLALILYFVKTRLSYANEWSSWCSVHVSSIIINKLPNATIAASISIL
jgi:hypothetical protein